MKSFLGERDLQLQTTLSQNLKSGTYLVLMLNPSTVFYNKHWIGFGLDLVTLSESRVYALFQVHTRQEACMSATTTCNCAVAVREGNDILGIQACYGSITMIRYLRDTNTPDGMAKIEKLSARSYKVR